MWFVHEEQIRSVELRQLVHYKQTVGPSTQHGSSAQHTRISVASKSPFRTPGQRGINPSRGTADTSARQRSAKIGKFVNPSTGTFYTPDAAVARGLITESQKASYRDGLYAQHSMAA